MSENGSEWGRWDLHVHTKGTAKNDQFTTEDFDEFCVDFFKKALEKDIKVIGITDYITLKSYKLIKSFQDKIDDSNYFKDPNEKRKIKNILLIPNMELRILPSTDKGSAVNIHLLVNPQILSDFEDNFLHLLTYTHTTEKEYYAKDTSLIKLGRDKTGNDNLNQIAALKEGCRAFVLSLETIIKAFQKRPLLRKDIIVVVPNSNSDGASSFQGHEKNLQNKENATLSSVRESLYKVADAIFSSNPENRYFFLGARSENLDEYIKKFGSIKPCIHGSDAHTEEKLFEPDQKRYCWIKAEPSFEGLKQILHEPESRVYIGAARPDLKNDYEVIHYIEPNDENIANEKIYFNQNLTSIIGGRSSGKSTLLKCLAKKLKGEGNDLYINNLCKNLKIIWRDGKEDDTREIEYFSQGHMYNKTTEQGIEDIVKGLLKQKNQHLFDDYEKKIADIRTENSGKVSEYFAIDRQIKEKTQSLKEKGNPKDIQTEIEKLSSTISSYQTANCNETDIKWHEEQNGLIKSYVCKIDILNEDIIQLDEIKSNDVFEIKESLPLKGEYAEYENNFKSILKDIKSYADSKINSYCSDFKEHLINKKSEFEAKITEIRNQNRFIDVSKFLENSASIKPYLEKREEENEKLLSINKINSEISELQDRYKYLNSLIAENLKLIGRHLDKLIEKINSVVISEDLNINSTREFKKEKFKEFIENHIDQRSAKAQEFADFCVDNSENLINLFENIKKESISGSIKLRSASDLEKFAKEFFDTLWFKEKFDISYDGDSYNQMSQGKKAFVVLKMNLEFSDKRCPIIIDQPEDDLDNRAIFSELVAYLKKKKSERQIILVTHNANVVVNADSELVIIANQNGIKTPNRDNKKFQYKYGAIENLIVNKKASSILDQKTIKEHICEIVEGGDKAFKLREKKYNF